MRTPVVTIRTLVLLALSCSTAVAATGQQSCYSSQMKALGALCSAYSRCLADVSAAGTGSCAIVDLQTKSLANILKAEDSKDCVVEGMVAFDAATADMEVALTAFAEILKPSHTVNACAAAKLSAIGKSCSASFKCLGTDYLTGGKKPAPECLNKNGEKMAKVFTAVEGKTTCSPAVSVDDVALPLLEGMILPVSTSYLVP